MKESDLIPMKDYVKTRNGDICCFAGNELIDLHSYVPMKDYNEELISIDGKSEWDIMAIYRTTSILNLSHIDRHILYTLESIKSGEINPIWERDEKTKIFHNEYVILKNLDKKCKWIARDKHGSLCLYGEKPSRANACWLGNNNTFRLFTMYEHMFQFVQWEDEAPYYIPDLLSWYESCSEEE